jgi:hypothetical protein
MATEIKGDIAVLEEGTTLKDLSSTPAAPKTGYQKLYVRANQLMAQTSAGVERNLEEANKVTNNASVSSQTILNATTYWHPSLNIPIGQTYTVNVGGTLLSAGTMVVDGTLISNGDTIVLGV